MKLFFIFLIVTAIDTKSVFSQDNGFGVLWAYNDWGDIIKGPPEWYVYYPHCGTGDGTEHQSPIDIATDDVVSVSDLSKNIQYLEYFTTQFSAQNQGNTIVLTSADPDSFVVTDPANSSVTYKLFSFHFHWSDVSDDGCEHKIDGNSHALEMHLLHVRSDFTSVNEAVSSGESDALLVIAIFYDVGNPSNQFQLIADAMPSILYPYNSVTIDGIEVTTFFPSNLNYYTYSGSLTTPGCDEVVKWVVLQNPNSLSQSQLDSLRTMHHSPQPANNSESDSVSSDENILVDVVCNARPIQPINGRPVSAPSETTVKTGARILIVVSLALVVLAMIIILLVVVYKTHRSNTANDYISIN